MHLNLTFREHGMRKVFYDWEKPFKDYFDVPLSMYFDESRGGFQITPFLTQIVEYEGLQPGNALFEKYGLIAQSMIANIMNDCKEVILFYGAVKEPSDQDASR